MNIEHAIQIAECLRVAIYELKVQAGAVSIEVSFSAGIAEIMPNSDPAITIKQADEYLYKAKQSGRNRLCYPPTT